MLKILLATPYGTDFSGLIGFYGKALRSLGHQVELVSILAAPRLQDRIHHQVTRFRPYGSNPDLNGERIVAVAKRFGPDLVIIGRGERLAPEPIRFLRNFCRFGCINIYPDSPLVIPGSGALRMRSALQEYTCVYTFSRGLIPVFEQLGAKLVRRLPFGYDPDVHQIATGIDPKWKTKLAYFGAWGPLQDSWLAPLAGEKLKIYGTGWSRSKASPNLKESWHEGRGIGPEMAIAIAGADVVVNIIRAEHGCAHSMKTFEIPACGGFVITNWTEEQAEFFVSDKHCVYFRTQEELFDKVKYYTSHESARIKIALAGCLEARKHPYRIRASAILDDLIRCAS